MRTIVVPLTNIELSGKYDFRSPMFSNKVGSDLQFGVQTNLEFREFLNNLIERSPVTVRASPKYRVLKEHADCYRVDFTISGRDFIDATNKFTIDFEGETHNVVIMLMEKEHALQYDWHHWADNKSLRTHLFWRLESYLELSDLPEVSRKVILGTMQYIDENLKPTLKVEEK